MALYTLPSNVPVDGRVEQGAPKVFLAPYVSAFGAVNAVSTNAVASPGCYAYLGPLTDAAKAKLGPEWRELRNGEAFAPTSRRKVGENGEVAVNLYEIDKAILAALTTGAPLTTNSTNGASTISCSGVTTNTFAGGGLGASNTNQSETYYRVMVDYPSGGNSSNTALRSQLEICKAALTLAGEYGPTRDAPASIQFTIKAMEDVSVTAVAGSAGKLWKWQYQTD